jgi:hypothetical protein
MPTGICSACGNHNLILFFLFSSFITGLSNKSNRRVPLAEQERHTLPVNMSSTHVLFVGFRIVVCRFFSFHHCLSLYLPVLVIPVIYSSYPIKCQRFIYYTWFIIYIMDITAILRFLVQDCLHLCDTELIGKYSVFSQL